MARCDLCGASCAAHTLEELHPADQTRGVKDVCPACAKWLDRVRRAALAKVPKLVREAVRRRATRAWYRAWNTTMTDAKRAVD